MIFISTEIEQRSFVDPRLSDLCSEEELAEFEKSLSESSNSTVSMHAQIDPEILSKCGRGLDGRKGIDLRKFEII